QAQWPAEFRRIGEHLRQTVGESALRIDHIGSTSVAQLAAKDVIDIQITVAHLPDETLIDKLRAQGFRPHEQIRTDSFIGLEDATSPELAKHLVREPEGGR